MASLSILVPYRPNTPHRERLWAWVRRYLEYYLPDAELLAMDSQDDPFAYGNSVNKAFQASTGEHLLIADADTVFSPLFIEEGRQSLSQHPWVATVSYIEISPEGTESLLQSEPRDLHRPAEHFIQAEYHSFAGAILLTCEAFETVGGYDTRFRGWGWMDGALFTCLKTLVGQPYEIRDTMTMHLWHPIILNEQKFNPYAAESQLLGWRYTEALGDPDAMRRVRFGV